MLTIKTRTRWITRLIAPFCLFLLPPLLTAANAHETALNTTNVNAANFGKIFRYYVDGAVYAQPLYVPALSVAGHGICNVLLVATMNDKVYAFEADKTGPPLWMRDFTSETAGITPIPVVDITNDNALNVVGNVGIEGTPAIDNPAGVLYLVVRTKEQGGYVQRLHKLRLSDGQDAIPAAVIEASVPGSAREAVNGQLHFDPRAGNQRPGLVLVNGFIVIAWASHEDFRPYHGWIMSYDAATLKQTGAICTTPDTEDGGVWQSGRAPAVDADGGIYFEIGNGGWDGNRNFGESFVKLRASASGLSVEDYFTPHNYADLNERDIDLGSSGPLLIPGTSLLIGGGKMGAMFTVDAKHLGKMTPGDTGILQTIPVNGGQIKPGPAFWNGPNGPAVFIWSETDFPKAFRLTDRSFNPIPFAKGTVASHGSPGGTLAVSSNEKIPGSAILWATSGQGKSGDHGTIPGVLHAFDAETLEEIWNSEQEAARDRMGTLVKFVPPVIAAGRVYVTSYDNSVNVYGLLPAAAK